MDTHNVLRTVTFVTRRNRGAAVMLADGRVMFYDIFLNVCGITRGNAQCSVYGVNAQYDSGNWLHPSLTDWEMAGCWKDDLYRAAVLQTFDPSEQLMLRVLRTLR